MHATRARKSRWIAALTIVVILIASALAFTSATAPATAAPADAPAKAPQAQCTPQATVVSGPARLRSGPGTNYDELGLVPQNVTVPIIGRNADSSWYQVVYSGATGWISASLLAPSCTQGVPVVNVPPPSPGNPVAPPSNPFNLQATQTTVQPGQCTTISWNVSNVAAVYFGDGANMQGVGGNDSRQVCPTQTTTYHLRVVYNNGQTVDQPITIYVQNTSQNPANFRADSYTIVAGQCTTLRWDIDQSQVWGVYLERQGNWSGVPASGSANVCPTTPTVYRLKVDFKNGQEVITPLTINVTGGAPAQVTFYADNTVIQRGQCTNLHWTIQNFLSAYLIDTGANSRTLVGPTGNIQVCPQNTSTYFLQVTGLDGNVVQPSVTITVQ
jgi:hypothetical protein